MSAPIAILLADVHFSLPTLELATEALITAVRRACDLDVPLVIAGDLTDGKAVIRGEVANRLIEIFRTFHAEKIEIIVTIGNHDRINERAKEHALNFLDPYCYIINDCERLLNLGYIVAYHSDVAELRKLLTTIPSGSLLIMHQGLIGSNAGHYMQDKSALSPDDVKDFRVISGHYHRAQDIKCGRPRRGAVGLFSYVGNPYSLSFGEAQDPAKGYAVLYADGSLERVPLNFRKHIIVEHTIGSETEIASIDSTDLVWLKLHGPASELRKIDKKALGEALLGHSNYKLELIPDAAPTIAPSEKKELTSDQIFDKIIDNSAETEERKSYLKQLWREIY